MVAKNTDDAVDAAKKLHGHVSGKLRLKNAQTQLGVVESNGSVRPITGASANPQTPTNDSIIDKVSGVAGSAADAAVAGAMFAPMLVPAGASATEWVGKKTGAKIIENAGKSTKRFIEKPFSEVFKNFPGADKIAGGVQKTVDVLGKGLNWGAEVSGAKKFVPKIHEWRLKSHSAKLGKILETADAHHGNLPESLQNHAKEILEHARNPTGNINAEKLEAVNKLFADEAAKLNGLMSSENAAIKHINKIGKIASNAAGSHVSIASLKSSKSVLSEFPQAVGKTSVLQAGANLAFVGIAGMEMFGAAKSFSQNLSSLKEIYHDITGKKASTLAILTGDVPAPVAEERSKLMKSFAVSEVTGAASLGLMVMSAIRGKVGILGFVAPAAVGMGANALIGKSTLPYYTAMKQAHAAGQQIPVEAYADFVGKASPELKARGAEASKFSQALATQYAAENASPAQIMREATNGGVMKRVNALIAANETAKTTGTAVSTAKTSHVAALQEQNTNFILPRRDNPVIGDYTKQLVANAGQANHALTNK